MYQKLLSVGLAALIGTAGVSAANFTQYRSPSQAYARIQPRQGEPDQRHWHKEFTKTSSNRQEVNKIGSGALDPVSSWGCLYTPSGETWMYTAEYTYTAEGSIENVDLTLLDADFKEYSSVSIPLTLSEGETSINQVELVPTITKKFFNYDDAYEIMVFIHATTEDYMGSYYTKVFSLKDGHHIMDIDGNNIGNVNTAPDQWSENYTMLFMREEVDEEYNYTLFFDVYKKAGWGTDATCVHTFEVDYATFAGSDGSALPILMAARDGKDIFYALPHYEKPFFEEDSYWTETPTPTPDNTFIIDLYNDNYELVKSTRIPMTTKEGYMYSFPGIGEFNGFDDIAFEVNKESSLPCYYVATENYVPTMDDFVIDVEVYDTDGVKLNTVFEDAQDFVWLSDIDGYENQHCCIKTEGETIYYSMVNTPSCQEVARINAMLEDGNYISTSLDRTPTKDGYMYVASLSMAYSDPQGNALHKMAWLDANGALNHYDTINLGQDIAMAYPYVRKEAFDPYLFNTDSSVEYMFLVKKYIDPAMSSRLNELFRVYGKDNNIILEMGPDEATGNILNSIFLTNPGTSKAKLVVVYYGNEMFTITHHDLPLVKFAGGDGTAENPYQIANAGDLNKIYTEPYAHYVIVNNINFDGETFTMNKGDFHGTLDGQGHVLYNMDITGALFENLIGSAVVKNIEIQSSTIQAPAGGGFIAISSLGESASAAPKISNISIFNCSAYGSTEYFGGVIGNAFLFTNIEGCLVKNCDFSFDGESTAGGIVGRTRTGAAINSCYFSGAVEAATVGGILGVSASGDETIKNCHVVADIKGKTYAGGIIGNSKRTKVDNCYTEGSVEATGTVAAYAGGIVGNMEKTYEKNPTPTVCNNIVAMESIVANTDAADHIAHRIIGRSSIDIADIDWEKVTEDMDPSEYPLLPATPETTISGNYAIGIAVVNPEYADSHDSVEGQSITFTDVDDKFLVDHNWALGDNYAAPWMKGEQAMCLFFESKEPLDGSKPIINDNAAGTCITFDGESIMANGRAIEVFDLNGVKIASGNDTLNTSTFAKGVYVARSGKSALKIIVK